MFIIKWKGNDFSAEDVISQQKKPTLFSQIIQLSEASRCVESQTICESEQEKKYTTCVNIYVFVCA